MAAQQFEKCRAAHPGMKINATLRIAVSFLKVNYD